MFRLQLNPTRLVVRLVVLAAAFLALPVVAVLDHDHLGTTLAAMAALAPLVGLRIAALVQARREPVLGTISVDGVRLRGRTLDWTGIAAIRVDHLLRPLARFAWYRQRSGMIGLVTPAQLSFAGRVGARPAPELLIHVGETTARLDEILAALRAAHAEAAPEAVLLRLDR